MPLRRLRGLCGSSDNRPSPPRALNGPDLDEHVKLLEAVVDNFPGGISLFDRNHRLVLCNHQQLHLLDYPDSLFAQGAPTLEQIFRLNAQRGEYGSSDPVEDQVRERMALVMERRTHVYERTRPNGTVVQVRGVPLDGGGFVTTYLDVTEQRRSQSQIAYMAHHDALTGLPNRILFRDRLEQAIARARRGKKLAVHYIDLDRFKPINDSLGHAAGDQLLVLVAARMRAAIREMDTVARLGGDEFAIIQVEIEHRSDAEFLARRVIEAVSEPCEIFDQPVTVGATVGIAISADQADQCDALLQKADVALYDCKREAPGTCRVYSIMSKDVRAVDEFTTAA